MEWMALLSTCLCDRCGGEYPHDDDCQFNWILCWSRWHHRSPQGNDWVLLWYLSSPPLPAVGQGLMVGWALVGGVFASLFIGVQVMFEIREDERRRGINLRC